MPPRFGLAQWELAAMTRSGTTSANACINTSTNRCCMIARAPPPAGGCELTTLPGSATNVIGTRQPSFCGIAAPATPPLPPPLRTLKERKGIPAPEPTELTTDDKKARAAEAARMCRLRKSMAARGASQEEIAAAAPLKGNKRVTEGLEEAKLFGGGRFPAKMLAMFARTLSVPLPSIVLPATWTMDFAHAAYEILSTEYPKKNTLAEYTTDLTKGMTHIGVAPEVISEVRRLSHDMWVARTDDLRARTIELKGKLIVLPEMYEDVQALRDRLLAFLQGAPVTAQTAADMEVALSARPSELLTLYLGKEGIMGPLKKEKTEKAQMVDWPIVSVFDAPFIRLILGKWQNLPLEVREAAGKAIKKKLLPIWRRDDEEFQHFHLRKIGARLASDVRNAPTDSARMQIVREACRQEGVGSAADCYARVVRRSELPTQ